MQDLIKSFIIILRAIAVLITLPQPSSNWHRLVIAMRISVLPPVRFTCVCHLSQIKKTPTLDPKPKIHKYLTLQIIMFLCNQPNTIIINDDNINKFYF